MKTMAYRQCGISLTGMLMVAVVLGVVAIYGLKVIPAYMQNAEIKNIFNAIVRDPGMQGAQVREIRSAYSTRASVAYITVINPEDIEIGKEGNSISLSASYEVKLPLAGNASLLLEFNPSSSR